MVAVLLMVGRGLESPDVVCHLLNTAACANKPQYIMAPEARFPLVKNSVLVSDRQWRPSMSRGRQTVMKMKGIWRTGLQNASGWPSDKTSSIASHTAPAMHGTSTFRCVIPLPSDVL